MPDHRYNIFISYNSADSAHAEKLEADLKAAGLTPFRDKSRLTGGDAWEPQLVTSLNDSQHFVLLLSKTSLDSDWVTEERTRFKIIVDPHGTGALTNDRRILIVCLDQKVPPTLARFHAFTQYMDAANAEARTA